jgi:hypothetical protein
MARSSPLRHCRRRWTRGGRKYNTDRPHQSLKMAFPASRFALATLSLELRGPAQYEPQADPEPASRLASEAEPSRVALEVDRLVPPSGNLWIGRQRVWLGPALAGLAGRQLNVGYELAGQRVTLRMDGTQMAVISHDGALLRTLACPVPQDNRSRLRGARRAGNPPTPPSGQVVVQRRVWQRGSIMIATLKIHVGMIHARKIVTVIASDHSVELVIDGETVGIVPRTTTSEIHRYKAYATRTGKP